MKLKKNEKCWMENHVTLNIAGKTCEGFSVCAAWLVFKCHTNPDGFLLL